MKPTKQTARIRKKSSVLSALQTARIKTAKN